MWNDTRVKEEGFSEEFSDSSSNDSSSIEARSHSWSQSSPGAVSLNAPSNDGSSQRISGVRGAHRKGAHHQRTPEDEERRRIRRERNKLAAARCRQRRVDLTNQLLAETVSLEDEKSKLTQEIKNLERHRHQLEYVLDAHAPRCTATNLSSTSRHCSGTVASVRTESPSIHEDDHFLSTRSRGVSNEDSYSDYYRGSSPHIRPMRQAPQWQRFPTQNQQRQLISQGQQQQRQFRQQQQQQEQQQIRHQQLLRGHDEEMIANAIHSSPELVRREDRNFPAGSERQSGTSSNSYSFHDIRAKNTEKPLAFGATICMPKIEQRDISPKSETNGNSQNGVNNRSGRPLSLAVNQGSGDSSRRGYLSSTPVVITPLFELGLDSLMDGHTGLTPLTGCPSTVDDFHPQLLAPPTTSCSITSGGCIDLSPTTLMRL